MIFILAIAAFMSINGTHLTYEQFNNQKIEPVAVICYSGECA